MAVSGFARVPATNIHSNAIISRISSFAGEPCTLSLVCKRFSSHQRVYLGSNEKIYDATWEALFEAYKRDPILSGLAHGVQDYYPLFPHQYSYVSISMVVKKIYKIVHAKTMRFTVPGSHLPPSPLGKLDPARLSAMSKAADTINFLGSLKSISVVTERIFLAMTMDSLPEESRDVVGLAQVITQWMRNHGGKFSTLESASFKLDHWEEWTHLPDELGLLANVEILDMNGTEDRQDHSSGWGYGSWLRTLPTTVQACTRLQEVHCAYNRFTSIPVPLLACRSLQILGFTMNMLESVPDEIGNLKALKRLDLSCNGSLTSLPDGIGGLVALESLECHRTGLKMLPAQIGKLKSLRALELADTELRKIPLELAGCTSLTLLNLYSCDLFTMGKEEVVGITPWLKLVQFWIKDTPIVILPEHIMCDEWPLMRAFYAGAADADETKSASKKQRIEDDSFPALPDILDLSHWSEKDLD